MFDFTGMEREIRALPNRVAVALDAYGEAVAAKLETAAKRNRLWTDRTAHARQSISGSTERYDTGIRITLEIGVEYGVYLEFAHEKKYAVIYPTLKKEAPAALSGLRGLLERL